MVEVNYKKVSKKEKPVDPKSVDFKFSKFDLIKGILLRLSSRYSPEEIDYLTDKLGHPPHFLNNEGKNGLVATARMIKRYIRNWKSDNVNTPMVMNLDEYAELNDKCNDIINNKSTSQDPTPSVELKHLNLDANLVHIDETLELPTLTGGCIGPSNELVASAALVDTGSSVCLASMEYIKRLGYNESNLTNTNKYVIKTANKSSTASGTIALTLFLKSKNQDFYKFEVEFLITDTPLNKLILGYNFLTGSNYEMKSYRNQEQITLDCLSRDDMKVRRVFCTNSSNTPISFKNEDTVNVHSMEAKTVSLSTNNFVTPTNAQFYSNTKNVYLPTHCDGIVNNNDLEYIIECDHINGTIWPVKSKCIFSTTLLFRDKMSFSKQEMDVHLLHVDQNAKEMIEEMNSIDLSGSDRDPLDNAVFDSISPTPSYLGDAQFYPDDAETMNNNNSKKYPNTNHLPPIWEERYNELFNEYQSCLSQDKFDIGTAKLEPATFDLPKESVKDPVRTLSPLEHQIVCESINKLLAAGVIEENDGTSRFNSNVFLVSQNSETTKKLSTAIADKVSREKQLDSLRKSGRFVIDLSKVNRAVKTLPSATVLPVLDAVLPNFANKLISKIDQRQGFHSILLDEKVKCLTNFTLQDGRSFNYRVLPQGFKLSPSIYQRKLAQILNEKSFEEFKKDHEKLKNVPFTSSFVIYLDDIAIVSEIDYEIHFLLWKYCLQQFTEYNIKLNCAKCVVLKASETEYLGVAINYETSQYHLTNDRAQAFQNWEFPLSRASTISRICTLNFFRNIIPCLKMLISCLMILCRESCEFKPLKLHVFEFQQVQFLCSMNIRLNLPSMLHSCLISTDSSHLAYAGAIHNWIRPSQSALTFYEKRDKLNTSNNAKHSSNHNIGTSNAETVQNSNSTKWKGHCAHKEPLCNTYPCKLFYKDKMSQINDIYPPDSPYMYPFNKPNITQDELKENSTPHFDVEDDAPQLVLCGVFSKSYPVQSLLQPINRKEIFTILETLLFFQTWIRNSLMPSFLFSDISYVSFLCRLKSTSSKLYAISVFLSSFHNLHFVWSRSRFYNSICDLFSRINVNHQIQSDYGIPADILEPKNAFVHTGDMIIPAKTLHKVIMTTAPSEYSSTPFRRSVQFNELPTPSELNTLLDNPTNEEMAFKLLWYGSSKIDNKDSLFVNKDNNKKLLNKDEFRKIEKTMKMDELRTVLAKIDAHSYHVSSFSDISLQTKNFANELKIFMDANKLQTFEPSLYALTMSYCNDSTNTLTDFKNLLNAFHNSSLVNNTSKFNPRNQLFILVTQGKNSGVHLDTVDRSLTLRTKSYTNLNASETAVIPFEIGIKSKYISEIFLNFPSSILFHITTTFLGNQTIYGKLYLVNPGPDPYNISANQTIGRLKISPEDECCENVTDIIFVHSSLPDDVLEETHPRIHITNIMNTVLQHPSRPRPDEVHFPALVSFENYMVSTIPDIDYEAQLINRFILLARILNNNNQIPHQLIQQLQDSDPDISRIKKLTENKTTNQYQLINGVLVKKVDNTIKLLLDRVTLTSICDSMHNSNFHYSSDVLFNHINKHFFHPKLKTIVRDSGNACSACQFSLKTNKIKYTNNPKELDSQLIGHTISVDFIQNTPYSNKNYKYIFIAIEEISGVCYGIPTKTTSTEETIKCMLQIFSIFNIPHQIKSDFGSSFTSHAFFEFLSEYGVQHEHKIPGRSQGNSQIERNLKLWRDLLTSIILHSPPSARRNWHEYTNICNIIFNNSIPYSRVNCLSRYNLLHTNFKYQPNHMISAFPDASPDDIMSMQESAVQRIINTKHKARKHYKNVQNPFKVNNLVQIVKGKSDQTSENLGTAFKETSANLYRVTKIMDTGCRLLSLVNKNEEITVDFNRLKLASPKILFANLGTAPFDIGQFNRNVYRSGSDKSILELLIQDSKTKSKSPSDLVKDKDYVLVSDEDAEQTSTILNEQKPVDSDPNVKHNLRSRKIYFNQVGKIKKVKFNNLTYCVDYYTNDKPISLQPVIYNQNLVDIKRENLMQIFMSSIPSHDISSKELIDLQVKYAEYYLSQITKS